jgi:hypothetical protein
MGMIPVTAVAGAAQASAPRRKATSSPAPDAASRWVPERETPTTTVMAADATATRTVAVILPPK